MSGAKPPPTPRGGGNRFLGWLKYEWHTPFAVIGGVLAPLSKLASGKTSNAILIVGVALVAVGAVGAAVNRNRVAKLEKRLNDAEADRDAAQADLTTVAQVSKAVYRSLLSNIAGELGLSPRERISIYVHDAGLPSFQLLSRHSSNQSLEDAPGRRIYRDTEGIIGKAWREGYAEETSLPDPVVGGADYVAENYKKYSLPTEVTEGLAMKSRALVAVRYPTDSIGDKHIGVLVAESLDDSWDISDVKPTLDGSDWWFTLQEHLKARRHQLPVLSNAEGKGF